MKKIVEGNSLQFDSFLIYPGLLGAVSEREVGVILGFVPHMILRHDGCAARCGSAVQEHYFFACMRRRRSVPAGAQLTRTLFDGK